MADKKQPKAEKRTTKPRIPIDLVEVERLAGMGLTREQIALCLGISETTLYDRQRESEEFAQAIKKGEAVGIQQVANKLFSKATVDGDTTSLIFYLKTRAGWKETQVNEHRFPEGFGEGADKALLEDYAKGK